MSRGKFDDNDDDDDEFMIFHPVSYLETLLRANFSLRAIEMPSLLEKCPFPIALWICQES